VSVTSYETLIVTPVAPPLASAVPDQAAEEAEPVPPAASPAAGTEAPAPEAGEPSQTPPGAEAGSPEPPLPGAHHPEKE
jgi:hypothetical protein